MNHKKGYKSYAEAARSKAAQFPGSVINTGCPCGMVHVDRPRGAVVTELRPNDSEGKPAATKRPRYTGPDRLTRLMVLKRDRFLCVCCGTPAGPGVGPYSIQHRVARGVGGGNSLENLILLAGSATTLCHGRVESKRDPRDLARGYRLESWQNPATEPVTVFTGPGESVTVWLSDDGEYLFEAPEVAA